MFLQSSSEIARHLRKAVLFRSHKQFKTPFKDHMVRFKIISLYIYKHLRLKTYDLSSYESRDDNNEDGNLVPRSRCGFCLKAVLHLWGLKLTISVYARNATFL